MGSRVEYGTYVQHIGEGGGGRSRRTSSATAVSVGKRSNADREVRDLVGRRVLRRQLYVSQVAALPCIVDAAFGVCRRCTCILYPREIVCVVFIDLPCTRRVPAIRSHLARSLARNRVHAAGNFAFVVLRNKS